MKRFFSFLLALALACLLIPARQASAVEESPAEEAEIRYCKSSSDGENALRDMLLQRIPLCTIKYPAHVYSKNLAEFVLDKVLHNDIFPTGGDNFLFTVTVKSCTVALEDGFAVTSYVFEYLTTAEQEKELNAAVEKLLAELNFDLTGQYDIMEKVYRWVCENVTPVPEGEATALDQTAYGALVNRRAASQGIALLIYRLTRELFIDGYVVSGTFAGEKHTWNMVRVEEMYGYVDASLDAGKTEYSYFLKGSTGMPEHIPEPDAYDRVLPEVPEEYVRLALRCEEMGGHYWSSGTCVEPKYCSKCGTVSDEYGPHEFAMGLKCEDAKVCLLCHKLFPGGTHTYLNDEWIRCSNCDHIRELLCVGESLDYRVYTDRVDQIPTFSQVPGMQVTLTSDYTDAFLGHGWDYSLTFTEPVEQVITVTRGEGQEPEEIDVWVREHKYSNGRCFYCSKPDENYCWHDWEHATCQAPTTCKLCGQTNGEIGEHYFYTTDCGNIPGVCTTCGLVQEEPPGHQIKNLQCRRCNRGVTTGCLKNGCRYTVSSTDPRGYVLSEIDPSLTYEEPVLTQNEEYKHWTYTFHASEQGMYIVTFQSVAEGYTTRILVNLVEHEYVDGQCPGCHEPDPSVEVHVHEFSPATCTEPATCACGDIDGMPLGHDFGEIPCADGGKCSRCDETFKHNYDIPYCMYCNRTLMTKTICRDVPNTWLLSSEDLGDYYLADAPEGVSLALLEWFVSGDIYYWEYALYGTEPGEYELDILKKDSEEVIGLKLTVVDHDYENGVCQVCDYREGEHIHTWSSATCEKPARCSQCDEAEGKRLRHAYDVSCSVYGICTRCKKDRNPISHDYGENKAKYCINCRQEVFRFCEEDGGFTFDFYCKEDYKLTAQGVPGNVSWRLYDNIGEDLERGAHHTYRFEVKEEAYPGIYEIAMVNNSGAVRFRVTLIITRHSYGADGECVHCGSIRVDPGAHDHNWIKATCLTAKYCAYCGLTEGEPLGHKWIDATCQWAKHCEQCGEVIGEPAPHDYIIWSCTEPGVCSACNAFQDAPAGHAYENGICTRCGAEQTAKPGDVNNDGKADYSDALLILRASIGLETLTEEQKQIADVTGEGKADYSDALKILRASIGLDTLS